MVISGKKSALATSGVKGCFAVCLRGKTKEGKAVIGLVHTSHIFPLTTVIQIVLSKMHDHECIPDSIEIFVLEGNLCFNDGKEGLCISTITQEVEVLKLVQTYNIKGVLFNHSPGEDSLDVVLTTDKIYFGLNDLFYPLPGLEEAGEQIYFFLLSK